MITEKTLANCKNIMQNILNEEIKMLG